MESQQELYQAGVQLSKAFLDLNKIPHPTYWTYAEAKADAAFQLTRPGKLLNLISDGPLQGTGTGYYTDNNIFVNVPACAFPVKNPGHRSWSYPGYKIDRTPLGVIAHETGHHVDEWLYSQGIHYSRRVSAWVNLAKKSKRITSYEPVPAEAWAETMRLFITNPQLLELGSPTRYRYLLVECQLVPLDRGTFKAVLNNHPAYLAQAERWISQAK